MAQTARPQPLAVNTSGIPRTLRPRKKRWLAWVYEWDDKKQRWQKRPFNPKTGSTGWRQKINGTDFDEAFGHYEADASIDGLGMALVKPMEIVVLDIDDCVDDQGQIEAWTVDILDEANSYTETSPSGHGLRVVVESAFELPANEIDIHGHAVEVYNERFVTFTGQRRKHYRAEMKNGDALLKRLFSRAKHVNRAIDLRERSTMILPPGVGTSRLPNDEVFRRMRKYPDAATVI